MFIWLHPACKHLPSYSALFYCGASLAQAYTSMASSTLLPASILLCMAMHAGAQAATTPQPKVEPGAAIETQPSTGPALGNWITGHSVDPYTGQYYPYASLSSATTPAMLSLLCGRYQTVVNLHWGQTVSSEHINVRYTPHLHGDIPTENWVVSKHSATLTFPRDGNELFDYLLSSPTITLELFPVNAPSVVVNFSTQGADTALQDLINVCGST